MRPCGDRRVLTPSRAGESPDAIQGIDTVALAGVAAKCAQDLSGLSRQPAVRPEPWRRSAIGCASNVLMRIDPKRKGTGSPSSPRQIVRIPIGAPKGGSGGTTAGAGRKGLRNIPHGFPVSSTADGHAPNPAWGKGRRSPVSSLKIQAYRHVEGET
jgi:hypothetical protein